jgi:dTDP-4-dehydrorhamnose reductase
MKDILLIGATGQLGGSLLSGEAASRVHAPSRTELDVADAASVRHCIETYQPRIVINTAAFHNVPVCENQAGRALEVNCVAVYRLAAICAEKNIRLVSFSTDYVFDGGQSHPYLEADLPAPIQMYGISRAAGEYAALAAAPRHAYVIRTCGLYGEQGAASKGGNFVDKRLADAQQSSSLDMSCDQTVCPTYTADLAQAVMRLVDHPDAEPGIYHLVNQGACTWAEFTAAIYEECGLTTQVNPVDRGGLTGSMRRPRYSVLANTRAAALGIKLPHWRDALKRYLYRKGLRTTTN